MTSDYLQKLARLRTDANRSRWTEATAHRAPHKPFLLLSVMDLAAQGELTSPFIEPGFDLIERFARYWDLVRPPSGKCNMAYPFFHMRSEGFWHLVPGPEIRWWVIFQAVRASMVFKFREIRESLVNKLDGLC